MIKPVADLLGRVLLASIFLPSGIMKITGYAATQAYMQSQGVPGVLLPLVILTEVGVSSLLIIGWQTRLAAVALAGFSVLAGILFHLHGGDQTQQIMFMKNLAIAGGLLVLAAHGPDRFSIDNRTR